MIIFSKKFGCKDKLLSNREGLGERMKTDGKKIQDFKLFICEPEKIF